MKSLNLIEKAKSGDRNVLRDNKWLQYLYLTKEQHINLEQVDSLERMPENPILPYVERTLLVLSEMDLPLKEKSIIEEVLVWSEVAKGGMRHNRRIWRENGFQLDIHNIGSAQIYAAEQMHLSLHQRDLEKEELIYTLILTHGLFGQFIRGEVRYKQLQPLIHWVEEQNNIDVNIEVVLNKLNQCIIQGVSNDIWDKVKDDTGRLISSIVNKEQLKELPLKVRIRRLRQSSIQKGENFDKQYDQYMKNEHLNKYIEGFFKKTDMWYVESALQEFSLEEFLKIFILIYQKINPLSIQQVSFESFMKDIYYDYKGKKSINLYKKRIIESYLNEFSLEDLLQGKNSVNEHVELQTEPMDLFGQIVGVRFRYSAAGEKLIEFCQEAEKSPHYERATILLYDFFGFRKDAFDRLQNEQTYLTDMNNGQDHKRIISDYATGTLMLDIGAGGGVMLDILSEDHPEAEVVGIDVSTNVIEELNKRKNRENKRWQVKQADALELKDYYDSGSIDTIVFSSILHEMFSYIPYKGKKFNHEVIIQALKSSFEVLNDGGRIIIRDGIMTEPNDMRYLKFKDEKGHEFFSRYVKDFKGREIAYDVVDDGNIKLAVNDAMEFLYTYTWGEEAYPHEVQEQFGYFTPSEFKKAIEEALGDKARIVAFKHYLQDGYEEFLSPKVKVMDEQGVEGLPDSTCFIVIEKE
ncbi:methyltransferase type 12 [Terribacillus saccharophilus]|uniref:Methyltransferase type 12 n=1 Tax=Terribacillus saccharophilus TaxID=361277 RepID=A0A075LI83_9BACI|nr:class I SAM-dependent methyltransferase [Terribacillus goriensis]AIF65587.1 methyltransferase type 12 [Terribacillus goriensis]